MIQSSPGQIFISASRNTRQTSAGRTCEGLRPAGRQHEAATGFGDLECFDEETLAARATLALHSPGSRCRMLLPVVGSVAFKVDGIETMVHPGEALFYCLASGSTALCGNPYENELISFLNIGLQCPHAISDGAMTLLSFNLDDHANQLTALAGSSHSQSVRPAWLPGFAIGKFDARTDSLYEIKNSPKGIFIFVVEGIFEVAGRLLHARDGLHLSNVAAPVEIEALSQGAIILLLETTV